MIKTLNLFLAHRTFAEQMGGSARRAILFEGPPGTGQDLHGQGHGRRGRRALPLRLVVGVPVDVLRADQPQDPRPTSRPCASTPGARAAPSGSSRRSTPSVAPGAAWAAVAPRGHPGRGQRAADPAAVLRPDPARRSASTGWLVDGVNSWLPPPPASRQADARPGQHPGHRRHQPGRRPRPGPRCARAASTAPSTSTCPVGPGGGTSSTTTWARRPTSAELDDPANRDTLAAMTVRATRR